MELIVDHIRNKIHQIRGVSVMLDNDLAELYQVESKVLNQAVKRNLFRFPDSFRFQLEEEEINILRSQLVTPSEQHGGRRYLPYAFTEQGIAMLSTVLRSENAVKLSIQIMQTFVAMRKTLSYMPGFIQRLEYVELKQLKTDSKLEQILNALETDFIPSQGVFFEGQLFDAHVFAINLIKQSNNHLTLIDNYVDENTLLLLNKRKSGVNCTIYTRLNPTLKRDLEKFNKQYPVINVIENRCSHDRFLIIDSKHLYHIGASIKDLGNKCFAFSRMDSLLEEIKTNLL